MGNKKSQPEKYTELRELVRINFSSHTYSNRYYQTLIDYVKIKTSDNQLQKALDQDYKTLYEEQMFVPSIILMSRPEPIHRIDSRPFVIGYKLVSLLYPERYTRAIIDNIAIVQLKITGDVVNSVTKEKVPNAYELKYEDKLCTNEAVVISVQFIGKIDRTIKRVDQFQEGQIELVSQFNSKFVYRLGHQISEPNLGKPGIGCIQGIHFFINKKDCIKYLDIGFSGIDLFGTVISAQIDSTIIERGNRLKKIKHNLPSIREFNSPDGLRLIVEDSEEPNPIPQVFHNCSICSGDIWKYDVCMSQCQHTFHKACISKYLLENVCPLCKEGKLV